jgi:S-adenosylmethionine:tRNA ribosyltransferase-isomerase
MNISEFNYNLPKERIAQKSVEPRDHSKMMVINKKNKTIDHRHFYDIVEYFREGDVIVWNNSKVFKARLHGRLLSDTGRELLHHKKDIEIFLVRPTENIGVWQVLAKPGKHVKAGTKISFGKDFYCDVLVKKPEGTILVQFPYNEATVRAKANQYGNIPIPPYVKDEPHELEMYQTVYAKNEGSVAAPTAGFHFTPEIIEKLKKKGVEFAEVTLHVGLGTFLPVRAENIEEHIMHSEQVEVTEEVARKINKAKKNNNRIIAVGTTSVRTLEGISSLTSSNKKVKKYSGDIDVFIKPGYKFNVVDAMITNFHLPKSTLLMLVSAFMEDKKFMFDAYEEAVKDEYRFFSFGDAMFIS